jgi:hypothetical protein
MTTFIFGSHPTRRPVREGVGASRKKFNAAMPVGRQNSGANFVSLDNTHVRDTLSSIEAELALLRPLKVQIQGLVERALEQSSKESLEGCHLEVVGSSSWSGDVPQSDLDLVVMTPLGHSVQRQAIDVLQDLQLSLESLPCSLHADPRGDSLQAMELIVTASVPILRLHCAAGLHCDISVDQKHSVAHRDLLRQLLESRTEARDLVRLVKFWLRRRGLPTVVEGGLPSLAWAIIVVRFVQSMPEDTPLEELLLGFFEEMQKLNDHSLCVRRYPSQDGGQHLEWKARSGSATAWTDEWLALVSVEDPCIQQPLCSHPSQKPGLRASITSPSMSAALGLLYVAELRLACTVARERRWSRLWDSSAHAFLPLSDAMADDKMHVLLKDGQLSVGMMQDLELSKGLLHGETLNRRDQSSLLSIRVCKLGVGWPSTVCAQECQAGVKVVGQPCNWVCAMPVDAHRALSAASLVLLAEIVELLGRACVSPEVYKAVLGWRHTHLAQTKPLMHVMLPEVCASDSNQLERSEAHLTVAASSSHDSAQPAQIHSSALDAESSQASMATLEKPSKECPDVELQLCSKTDPQKELGDDSTCASASDSESYSAVGGASAPSEATSIHSDGVTNAISARKTPAKPLRPAMMWKPTLRHEWEPPLDITPKQVWRRPRVVEQRTRTRACR